MKPSLHDTAVFVGDLFAGVKDKGGSPYFDHCFRVWWRLPKGCSDDEQHAAWLHDVLEDTGVSSEILRQRGYSKRTISLVEKLTKPSGADYEAWIIAIASSGDAGLIRIKIADNADNSSSERLAKLLPREADRLREKYRKSMSVLNASLTRLERAVA